MNKVALVTGANGFLGSHIVQNLNAAGYRVIEARRESLTLHVLSELLQCHKPNLVVHAAGSASVDESLQEPFADYEASVHLTALVIDALRRSCPDSHFVLLSSAAVYGAPVLNPISEDCATEPISPYGYHKLMSELLVQEAQKLFDLKATVLRVFSAYGERIRRQVIHDLCTKFMSSERDSIVLRGTGAETRDFIHAKDVAQAVKHVFETSTFGVYNLASGKQTSIAELADLVKEQLGSKATVTFDGIVRPGNPRFWEADITKLRRSGFTSTIQLSEGIQSYCEWFKCTADRQVSQTFITTLPESQRSEPNSDRPLIGFATMGTWMGGIAYLDILTKSLAQLPPDERPRMALVATEPNGLELYARIIERMEQIIVVGTPFRDLALPMQGSTAIRKVATLQAAVESLDVFFPVNSNVLNSEKAISWIPDFQHLHLPQLFSKEDRDDRDRRYQLIADQAAHVVFSSNDAARDFARYNSKKRAKVHVLPFYSLPDDSCYTADPGPTVAKYQLPKKYLICCNQFWEHKNHLTLFSAIKILRDHGVHVPLVCTGALSEGRNPEYIERVRASVRNLGIDDLVLILGEIPRAEQLQLMRAAVAVVQPSRFEGWSTVVEDARAFGKSIFLSDLPVHREQSPKWAIYFDPSNPLDLAEKIVLEAGNLAQGPNFERERDAHSEAHRLARACAENFMQIARRASTSTSYRTYSRATIDLSIVVATKNRAALLKQMLTSLGPAVRGLSYEVIVIDGGSSDGSAEVLSSLPGARIFDEERELGKGRHSWPELYNFGFQAARGTWSIFASDDITFGPNSFVNAIAALTKAPRRTVGGIFFYRNEIAEAGWEHFGIDFLARSLPLLNYGVIRTEVFRLLEGLNTGYKFYAADGDLTYKIANAGFVLSPLPGCTVVHHNRLDAQKQVNLKAVEQDMGTLKRTWASLGEGETVYPRRMFWEPRLANIFGLPLRSEARADTFARVWSLLSYLQHGLVERAAQEFKHLSISEVEPAIVHELRSLLDQGAAAQSIPLKDERALG